MQSHGPNREKGAEQIVVGSPTGTACPATFKGKCVLPVSGKDASLQDAPSDKDTSSSQELIESQVSVQENREQLSSSSSTPETEEKEKNISRNRPPHKSKSKSSQIISQKDEVQNNRNGNEECPNLGDNGKGETKTNGKASFSNPNNAIACVGGVVGKNETNIISSSTMVLANRDSVGRARSNSMPSSISDLYTAATGKSNDLIPTLTQSKNTATGTGVSKAKFLRRGKWTKEEEAYVARVIQEFNSGYLNAPAGTTLRSYLSEKLHCDPMRITKKFTGESCIGKRVFHPAVRCGSNSTAIDTAQAELDSLEQKWRDRIDLQKKVSMKTSTKKTKNGTTSSTCKRVQKICTDGGTKVEKRGVTSIPSSVSKSPSPEASPFSMPSASWLDRAQALLERKPLPGRTITSSRSKKNTADFEVTKAAPMPTIPDSRVKNGKRKVSEEYSCAAVDDHFTSQPATHSSSLTSGVADAMGQKTLTPLKRSQSMNSLSSLSSSEAKDAEALVGFLACVGHRECRREKTPSAEGSDKALCSTTAGS